MRNNNSLVVWQDSPFIEIFRIEEIDDTIFRNYQRYDFYQILWFTEISGDHSYWIDFKEYRILPESVVVLFPGQIDKLDPKGKKGFLFAVDPNTFFQINQRLNSDYLNGYFSNVVLPLNDECRENLHILMSLIWKEYLAAKRMVLLTSYVEVVLFHISAIFESKKTEFKGPVPGVPELMKLIDLYFLRERETDFYADKMGVTCKKLNLISKKGTTKTVKQHLQERLILEIKKEIRIGEKNLKEIAFDLGFSEPAYFTRFFKKHTGMSPTAFKDYG